MNINICQVWSRRMDTPRIQDVRSLEEQRLLVKFTNGVEKIYDCKPLMHLAAFQILKNEAFFKSVKVDSGGFGISWNDEVDLSEYELWENSKKENITW
jgi:hypothetical protein